MPRSGWRSLVASMMSISVEKLCSDMPPLPLSDHRDLPLEAAGDPLKDRVEVRSCHRDPMVLETHDGVVRIGGPPDQREDLVGQFQAAAGIVLERRFDPRQPR